MSERRARKEPSRKAISDSFRDALKEGLLESYAHLGVDPRQHQQDHETLQRVLPALEAEVIPFVKAERELANSRKQWFESIRADLTKDAARLLGAFLLLALFYGGGRALIRLLG